MASTRRGRQSMADRHERMSAVDTAWLRMDDAGNAMTIVSVLATATPVHAAALRETVATRLLCFSRFMRRPVSDAFGASWHEHLDFDLDQHFVVTQLPEPAGKTELQDLAARLAGERLDPTRPLWQIHFVERYGSGSAWVLRVHHCYADGVAMVRVLLSLTGQEQHPGADLLENAPAEDARLLESDVHPLFHPDDAANLAAHAGGMIAEFARLLALPDEPITPLRRALSGVKQVAWAAPLPLADVRTVARGLGCTVNDVLLATVAGALGAHLREAHGVDTSGLVLRASVPVNLRAAGEPAALGNKFGLAFVDLPVGTRDPLERVFHVHDTMRAIKGSLQPAMTLMVLGVVGMLPAALQASAIELFSRKGTLVASNVPGPQAPLHLCGQRISELYFWVPQGGSMGVGVSILSYAGQVFFGIVADRNLLPEPAGFVERFGPEFERLLLGATVGLLALRPQRRRRPRAGKRGGTRRQTIRPVGST